jgi:Fe-S-cluster containining protein
MRPMNASTDPDCDPTISCTRCDACCCRLEVMLMGDDDVPARLTAEDEWGGTVMRRLDDGWCVALDRNTMLCTIYERRPDVCREFAMGGNTCAEERREHVARWPARASAT